MGATPVLEHPVCTICGYPMPSIGPGERCPECGEVPADHPLLRIPASAAIALYVAAFVPVAVMGVVSAAILEGRSRMQGEGPPVWLQDLLGWLSWGAGLIAPIMCIVVTVLLFKRLPQRRRHAALLTVFPFSRVIVISIIVGLAAAAIAPVVWCGTCLATVAI